MKTCRAPSARLARALALLLMSSLLLTSCGGGGGGNPRSVSPPEPALLTITTTSLPDAWKSKPYKFTLQASGGSPPYRWSPGNEGLPEVFTLSNDGVLSGIPALGSGFSSIFTVQVSDSKSKTATHQLSLQHSMEMTLISGPPPEGNIAQEYSCLVEVEGGLYGTMSWDIAQDSDPLPPGLSLYGGGRAAGISGTPTTSGSFDLGLQISDRGNPPQTLVVNLTIVIQNHPVITTRILPVAVRNWPYGERLQAAGGSPPYLWSVVDPAPPELSLNASGELSGTPAQEGSYNFRVQLTDSSSSPEVRTDYVTLLVRPPLRMTTTRLHDGAKDNSYSSSVDLEGGRPPLSIRLASGVPPPGVTIASPTTEHGSFVFSGVPTATGAFPFSVDVADSSSPPALVSANLTISVYQRLEATPASLPEGLTGDPYQAALSATGGLPPYDWRLLGSPELPVPGLVLNSSTGEIMGTPTAAFDGTISFYVKDSATPPQVAYLYAVQLRIIGRLSVTTTRLPRGRPNTPYRVELSLFGGRAPFTWTISSGELPSGVSLNSATGQIAGIPTEEGISNFTVQVTDSGPPMQTATKALSMTITSNLGRNDSPATATPISNGTFRASISPYADPPAGPANPDHDYYALSASPGAVVTVETMAKRLTSPSPLDTVIEVVDADGNRLLTCRTPQVPYGNYDQPCLNDDLVTGFSQDSRLEIQIPGVGTTAVTFFVRVFSFDGNARPEYVYDLIVSGAN